MRTGGLHWRNWQRTTGNRTLSLVAGFSAFYDANIALSAELRNLLMHLAVLGLFRAKWSAGVHEEWISNLLKNQYDLTRDKLERTRMLMDKHAIDALLIGYEDLIQVYNFPIPMMTDMYWRLRCGQANVIRHDEPARLSV